MQGPNNRQKTVSLAQPVKFPAAPIQLASTASHNIASPCSGRLLRTRRASGPQVRVGIQPHRYPQRRPPCWGAPLLQRRGGPCATRGTLPERHPAAADRLLAHPWPACLTLRLAAPNGPSQVFSTEPFQSSPRTFAIQDAERDAPHASSQAAVASKTCHHTKCKHALRRPHPNAQSITKCPIECQLPNRSPNVNRSPNAQYITRSQACTPPASSKCTMASRHFTRTGTGNRKHDRASAEPSAWRTTPT